jgi:hypothetical protein
MVNQYINNQIGSWYDELHSKPKSNRLGALQNKDASHQQNSRKVDVIL